jgi:hypothetical protein
MTGILCILMAVSAYGQPKVGPGILSFLDVTPSVRAIGMGGICAPSLEPNAFSINPGNLGLVHDDNHVHMTLYPIRSKWGADDRITFRSYAASGNLLNGVMSRHRAFSLNVGYHYNRLMIGIPETTYAYPDGTGRFLYIGNHAHTATVALGVKEFFDIGLGVAGTYYRESSEDHKADGVSFHFGLLVRVPPERFTFLWRENADYRMIVSPRFGVAFRNVGPDFEYQGTDYPLNDAKHWGGAIDVGVQRHSLDSDILLLGLSPAIEHVSLEGTGYEKYGLEATFYQAVTGRLGYIDIDEDVGYNTRGLSINSRGLVNLITDLFAVPTKETNSTLRFLRHRLNISFNFARESATDSDDAVDYYSITLSL